MNQLNFLLFIITATFYYSHSFTEAFESPKNESSVHLPPWMIICNRNSPALERNVCIKSSVNKLLPMIKNGLPSLNVSGIDPFTMAYTSFQYSEGPLKMRIEMTNAKCNGLSRGRVRNVRSKVNDTSLTILLSIFFPKLEIQGGFNGETHLGEALVTSNGQVNITGALISTTFKISGTTQMRDDQKFMIVDNLQIAKNEIKGMRTDAVGLSNDKDLNALVLEFVNQNWEALYLQFFPQMKILFEPLLVEFVNEFFGHVPYDTLMPLKYD